MKILKILFIILIIAGLGALSYWLCLTKGWPWWVAAIMVVGIIGLWMGFLYLKRYLLRSRERKFVQRVIEQDTSALAKVPVSQRHELLELQEHWHESVKRLQSSHLRRKGNPLYVLPWYMILGDTGAGKTSAIKNARLSTPMTEVGRAAGLSGTRNCDWWFFEQAIVLDTAGRYSISVDEGQDQEEWKQFLVLLSKYRKREPLNGVIVAVAADRLLSLDVNKLRADGQSIRQRIDHIMRVLGAKFPVYILATKMDLVHGFTEFSHRLPQDSLAQAMGFTNTKNMIFWQDVMQEAVRSVGQKLRELRFLLIHNRSDIAPGSILFPNEFERLTPGLECFLKAVFEENAYQETPLLRGIYFSSALRDGTPKSQFLETTGVAPRNEVEAEPEDGFFLKDFFTNILPKDRHLFSPIREYLVWQRLTKSLGLLSWVLIGLAACGLLAFSFYHNAKTIRGFTEDFYDPPQLSHDRATDLMMLDRMRLEILEMDEKNRFWLLPRLGLSHSVQVEAEMKQHFGRLFTNGFLLPLDTRLFQRIGQVTEETPEDEFVDYVGYIVTRITLLKEHLAGKRLSLAAEFKKITADLLEVQTHQDALAREVADRFGDVYYAYLTWHPSRADCEQRLEEFRVALVHLLEKKGSDLRWLVRKWVPGVPDIHLYDFWGGSDKRDRRGQEALSGAYTAEGRKHIEAFIVLIEDALGDEKAKSLFEKRKQAFWIWYRQEFYHAWLIYIERFHEGMNRADTVAGWQRMASLMTTDRNPYFLLLDKVADEIGLLHPGKEAPPWSEMITRLQEIRKLAKTEKEREKGFSLTGKLLEKKEELTEKVLEKMDKEKVREHDEMLVQAKAWNEYTQDMAKLDDSVSTRKNGYDTYSGSFSFLADAPKNQSPFAEAYGDYYKLKGLLNGRSDVPVVWDLIFGPLDFVMAYAADETACFLQEQWEEQVLAVLQGADPEKVGRILFDKSGGVVWKFLDSTTKPFIGRSESGHYARQDFRKNTIPFKGEFLHFLNQGSEGVINYQPSYTVSFETLPLDVNEGAKVEPFACVLGVSCTDGKFSLENYNFPNSGTFTWAPEKCGDVSLTISLPQVSLQRVYKGQMGFPQFLSEFRDGTRTFSADDFPENKGDLKNRGIAWIKISYRIKGSEPVIRLLNRIPAQVPSAIVTCWARGK